MYSGISIKWTPLVQKNVSALQRFFLRQFDRKTKQSVPRHTVRLSEVSALQGSALQRFHCSEDSSECRLEIRPVPIFQSTIPQNNSSLSVSSSSVSLSFIASSLACYISLSKLKQPKTVGCPPAIPFTLILAFLQLNN